MSQTTGVKNYETINLHAPQVAPAATASRPKNATPEMFYKKDADDDENIISGIDEDLGESDVEMALEPIEKPKPKPVQVPEKKKVPTPQRKEEKPAAPKQEKQEDVKNITNIFYQDQKPITVFNNIQAQKMVYNVNIQNPMMHQPKETKIYTCINNYFMPKDGKDKPEEPQPKQYRQAMQHNRQSSNVRGV